MTTTALPATSTATTEPTAAPFSGKLQSGVLGATRVVVSFLFLCHGLVGLFGAWGGIDTMGGSVELFSWPDWWGSMIHLVAGALVGLGFFTRSAALLCSGSMAYAYFVVHQPEALVPTQNGGVTPALYAWAFLAIAVLGAGPWSLDALWRRRGTTTATATSEGAKERPVTERASV